MKHQQQCHSLGREHDKGMGTSCFPKAQGEQHSHRQAAHWSHSHLPACKCKSAPAGYGALLQGSGKSQAGDDSKPQDDSAQKSQTWHHRGLPNCRDLRFSS